MVMMMTMMIIIVFSCVAINYDDDDDDDNDDVLKMNNCPTIYLVYLGGRKYICLINRPCVAGATCLFTRLVESSLVPAGFLTAQFLQEM